MHLCLVPSLRNFICVPQLITCVLLAWCPGASLLLPCVENVIDMSIQLHNTMPACCEVLTVQGTVMFCQGQRICSNFCTNLCIRNFIMLLIFSIFSQNTVLQFKHPLHMLLVIHFSTFDCYCRCVKYYFYRAKCVCICCHIFAIHAACYIM